LRLKEERRPLRALRRYRALRDVIEQGRHLWKTSDNKARLAIMLLGPVNGVLLGALANPQLFQALPPLARVPIMAAVVSMGVVAVALMLLAIQTLQPYDLPRIADPEASRHPDAALGLRAPEDVAGRPLAQYRGAWARVWPSHLHAEMAAQAHAIAQVNQRKFAALARLYRGLQILTLSAVILGSVASVIAVLSPHDEPVLPRALTIKR
jgi:hypothetical protein